MVRNLEKAFDEASKLPEDEQVALAAWILQELASEKRWAEAFSDSHDTLSKLADEALAEHARGQTGKLNPDGIGILTRQSASAGSWLTFPKT